MIEVPLYRYTFSFVLKNTYKLDAGGNFPRIYMASEEVEFAPHPEPKIQNPTSHPGPKTHNTSHSQP